MISYELKFLTCSDAVETKNIDFKASKYESKKKGNDSVYDVAKRSYLERRGGSSRAPRSRLFRELESQLRDRCVVHCEWSTDSLITIVFSTGAIAYLSVNENSLDVTQILFDRYCVGKLSGQTVTGVVLSKTHLLFTHAECSATLITFGASKNASDVLSRIADRSPHVQSIELADGARRADRRVSWSPAGAGVGRGPRVLVWTAAGAEPAPWSPAPGVRANLHLYQLNGSQMNVIAYHQLENETLTAEIERDNHSAVHVVDQTTCPKTGVNLDWVRYEIDSSEEGVVRLSSHRAGGTRVSLPAAARAVWRAARGWRLLAACIDGTVHVVHHVAGLTHSTRAGFIPSTVCWTEHLAVCAADSARLQCFDRSLAALHHTAKCIQLQSYTSDPPQMNILATRSSPTGAVMLATFGGARALALLRLTHPNVALGWIRANRLSRAVSVLRAMDWDVQGDECLFVLQRIAAEVFRRPLCGATELAIQSALGSYLAPVNPLRSATRYHAAVTDLARKFFHHLLRRGRLDKAMSLAVDLSCWDLFSDYAAAARDPNDPRDPSDPRRALHADPASKSADTESGSECSESCSCSSHTSDTDSSRETTPPPLPRLPLPPPPTLMQVPIHTHEPTHTNSIRPLHQYLERDLTIWNTEVKEPTRWHSLDNVLDGNRNISRHRSLDTIDEQPSKGYAYPLYHRELNVPYRYQDYRERPDRASRHEKNVKFADTVTVNVVSEPLPGPVPSRELADSLPLCAPHAYLAAFEPAPPQPPPAPTQPPPAPTQPPPGTDDYVEV